MTRLRAAAPPRDIPLTSEGFDAMYAAHKDAVYRFAAALAGNAGDAEDLFQDTWFRVARSRQGPGPRETKAWLFTITANLHKDTLRKKRVRRLFFLERGRSMARQGADADTGWDSGRRAGVDVSGLTDLRICLGRAMARLPARQRLVFVLKEIEGFRHAEIAGMLGIPVPTVRTLLHRAVRRLQAELTAFGPESRTDSPAEG